MTFVVVTFLNGCYDAAARNLHGSLILNFLSFLDFFFFTERESNSLSRDEKFFIFAIFQCSGIF